MFYAKNNLFGEGLVPFRFLTTLLVMVCVCKCGVDYQHRVLVATSGCRDNICVNINKHFIAVDEWSQIIVSHKFEVLFQIIFR